MKIAIVMGTRPEIIKMTPVIHECEREQLNYFVLHTGQHYSHNMDRIFFDQFRLPEPKYNLGVGSGSHGEETAKMLVGIERVVRMERPSIVLVEGDTNTVLAGVLAAAKLGIPIGHIEAGLRSYDRTMPEEINRVIADHISDILFSPTKRARENLLKEGIASAKIHITGNTIVDILAQQMPLLKDESALDPSFENKSYLLLTLHRQENVDSKERLSDIMAGLKLVYDEFGFPIIYPVHPRARKRISESNLTLPNGITLIEPVDYITFLGLENRSRLILTDSGGVQEEACILRVPCVTLRYNTERPETIDVGANKLAGTEPAEILEKVKAMLDTATDWEIPFGDGTAAKQIIHIITNNPTNS